MVSTAITSLIFLLLVHLARDAEGLKCIVCADCTTNLPDPVECSFNMEPIPGMPPMPDMSSMPNPDFHCLKTVNQGKVLRICSPGKIDGCINDICSYSCKTDGCNAAPALIGGYTTLMAIVIAAFVAILGFKSG